MEYQNLLRFLVLTEWSEWTACRGFDSSICTGAGQRSRIRTCENGCCDISSKNLTITEDCEVTKDGFIT